MLWWFAFIGPKKLHRLIPFALASTRESKALDLEGASNKLEREMDTQIDWLMD